jgi:3-dehydroquinate synthase
LEESFTIKSMRYDYKVSFVPDFRQALQTLISNEQCIFLIDRQVWEIYDLASLIPPDRAKVTIIEAVESNKTINGVIDVWNLWEQAGVTKKDKIVVIGGGIIQDIGGFASNAYLRNVDWYFFPTTLLAQCDSCIGSKCAINLNAYKNQLGAFYAPKQIFIDTGFLKSLTKADFYSGMGEIFKMSLTSDAKFFEDFRQIILEERDIDELESLIRRSLLVKKDIIEKDEFDTDYRRILNYGHTFGHALEAYSNNQIPHGAAVTLGVDMANFIAWKMGFLTELEYRSAKEVATKIYRFEFPQNVDMGRLFAFMNKDKKSIGDKVNFIIPRKMGELQIIPMRLDGDLADLLYSYFDESQVLYKS